MSNGWNPGHALGVIEICEKLGVEDDTVERYRRAAARMAAKMLGDESKRLEDLYREEAFGIVTPGEK